MGTLIEFEMTWCDYLTPCPHMKDVEIGSYDCFECKYHVSMEQETIPPGQYFKIAKGKVVCEFPSIEESITNK